MNATRQARADAFYRCAETCREVEMAIDEAIWDILSSASEMREDVDLVPLSNRLTAAAFEAAKGKGTEILRAALIEAEQERLDTVRERDDALEQVEALRRQVDQLESEVQDLREASS